MSLGNMFGLSHLNQCASGGEPPIQPNVRPQKMQRYFAVTYVLSQNLTLRYSQASLTAELRRALFIEGRNPL
jgi:hypothetical protein